MSYELSTSSSRQEACSLVLVGLESLRKGLILYHELGLTTKEIYADLKAAGWDKSIHFLRRQETAMRKEGLLPESTLSKAATQRESVRKTAHEPVENSTSALTPVEPEPASTYLSDPVQQVPFEGFVRTSELYNQLSTQLSEINELIYQNHGNFTHDEYKSLCGTAFHIYTNLRTKCDHLEKLKRDRTDALDVESIQV